MRPNSAICAGYPAAMGRLISTLILAAVWATSASAQQGAALYMQHCAACHATAPAAPAADLALRSPARIEDFTRIVRHGGNGGGDMPAFGANVLRDDEVRALHSYLMSVRSQR